MGRLASVEADLGDPNVLSDSKRYRQTLRDHVFLKKLESAYNAYEKILGDIRGNEELLSDPDFRADAELEIASLKEALPEAEKRLLASLLEPDPFECRNAVLEIRAGTGGEEAALYNKIMDAVKSDDDGTLNTVSEEVMAKTNKNYAETVKITKGPDIEKLSTKELLFYIATALSDAAAALLTY